jgi:hypothetical protein
MKIRLTILATIVLLFILFALTASAHVQAETTTCWTSVTGHTYCRTTQ